MKRQSWSGLSLLWRSLSRHSSWQEQWRRAEPKPAYDAVIIGGGGHGLGTAYYLAAEHGLTNIAVVEKGWIGGGNTGRNTTIIRSNYLFDESARLYDHAVKLWEHLSQELNYNVMFSPRGVMMLAHTVHDVQVLKRHVHCQPLQWRGQRVADARGSKSVLSAAQCRSEHPLSGAGRCVAAARRHGASRCRRLGVCARSRRTRRRHHRELRSHGHSSRCEWRRRGARDLARPDPAAARLAWWRRAIPAS